MEISQSDFQLTVVKNNIYKPVFDLITGKYIDECPILPRQNMEFKCLCNQKTFNTNTKFKQHVTLKCHQRYVACYLDHLQDEQELKDEIKKTRSIYELNEKKLRFELVACQTKLRETQEKLEYAEKMLQPFVNPHYKYDNAYNVLVKNNLNG